MHDRSELLAACVAATLVFVAVVAPESVLVVGLGALGLGFAARLAEVRRRPIREVQNRR
ncbi:MAG: hypothetical protein ACRDF7_04815 [Candidatus Limnocylindrales bacterium]